MKQTIEQRIVTILNNEKSSAAEIAEIVREAESAAQTADQAVEAERAKAMDVVRSPNVEAAHRAVAEAVLARERLLALLAKLCMKLSEAQAAEAQERWLVEFNRVKQKRDEAAAAFRRYRERSQEIAYLFALAAEIDREIDHLNANAPYGVHQRLRYVENEARDVEFSRDRPSLAATVELRDWDNSGRLLWPQRHFGSLAAAFAQSMITPAVGARWSEPETQAERRREIERSQAQLAEFYRHATAEQEARQNRRGAAGRPSILSVASGCPLLGVKRKSDFGFVRSAFDPERKSRFSSRAYSSANMRFQSFFRLITVQPFFFASS